MAFQLSSPDFLDGQPIPRKFSCDGLDVSPRLSWKNTPAGTSSFTLILHDPDAPVGDWVHWVVYNIPSEITTLTEGIPTEKIFPNGMMQGRNSWHQVRYGGPCPPAGTHRYFFELYALDCILKLEAGSEQRDVMSAMQNHILAKAELMGTYIRIR
jgi:Raf kinase inhibitor-like YbhB/YbcL family protein